MNATEREALIDQYEDGFRAVSAALEAMTDPELEAREAPGEWSPREIVHHLAAGVRMPDLPPDPRRELEPTP